METRMGNTNSSHDVEMSSLSVVEDDRLHIGVKILYEYVCVCACLCILQICGIE